MTFTTTPDATRIRTFRACATVTIEPTRAWTCGSPQTTVVRSTQTLDLELLVDATDRQHARMEAVLKVKQFLAANDTPAGLNVTDITVTTVVRAEDLA